MLRAALACSALFVSGAGYAMDCPSGWVLLNGVCRERGPYHYGSPHHYGGSYHYGGFYHSGNGGPGNGGSGYQHPSYSYQHPSYGNRSPSGSGAGVNLAPPASPFVAAPAAPTPASPPRAAPPIIRDTGYAALFEAGKETPGYGLYSYAILSSPSDKSAALLADIIKSTLGVGQLNIDKQNINVLYMPIANGKQNSLAQVIRDDRNDLKKLGNDVDDIYDFGTARQILDHVCADPPVDMQALCHSDTSAGGPYLFTYTSPATSLDNYPPPYLFVDFTRVPEGAFPEWLSAYRSQVKQQDIHDGTWVKTFRLRILNYAMTASALITPVEGSVQNTIDSYIHPHE